MSEFAARNRLVGFPLPESVDDARSGARPMTQRGSGSSGRPCPVVLAGVVVGSRPRPPGAATRCSPSSCSSALPDARAPPPCGRPQRHLARAALLRLRGQPAGVDRRRARCSTCCSLSSGSTTRSSRACWPAPGCCSTSGCWPGARTSRSSGRSRWPLVWRRVLDARFELAQALAVGALVLAVLGAVRLNNGASGGVALAGQAVAAAALLALMLRREGTLGRDARTLALVSTSLLLATSLRGWSITGHDIQAEFLAFKLTNGDQHWQMGALENAYNACLSVNILPTVLAQTTGLSGELVFKVLLQLVFAVVPVLTFLYSRRFLSRRLALVATAFTLAFPTFFTDMPYLVRQEMAFFFLALMLLAATDRPGEVATPAGGSLRRGCRPLALLHDLRDADGAGVRAGRHDRAAGPAAPVPPRRGHRSHCVPWRLRHGAAQPPVVVFLLAASFLWAGPVTHTGGHASAVVKETIDAITGKGEDAPSSSDTSYRLFAERHLDTARAAEQLRRRDDDLPQREHSATRPADPEARPGRAPSGDRAGQQGAADRARRAARQGGHRPREGELGGQGRLCRADAGLPAARAGLAGVAPARHG